MNVELIKSLRAITSAAMSDCKSALQESGWNLEAAVDLIKIRGKAITAKKEGLATKEGRILIGKDKFGNLNLVSISSQTDFASNSEDFIEFCNTVIAALNEEKDIASVEPQREALIAKIRENVEIKRTAKLGAYRDASINRQYLHSNNKIGVIARFRGSNVAVMDSICCQIAATNPSALNKEGLPKNLVEHQTSIFKQQVAEMNKPEAAQAGIIAGKLNKWYKEVCLLDQESVEFPKKTIQQLCNENNIKVVEFVRFEVGEGVEVKEKDFAQEVAEMAK